MRIKGLLQKISLIYLCFCGAMANLYFLYKYDHYLSPVSAAFATLSSSEEKPLNTIRTPLNEYIANFPTVGPLTRNPSNTGYTTIFVDSSEEVLSAILNAKAGTEIIVKNGSYDFHGKRFNTSDSTLSSEHPIILRAETVNKVNFIFDSLEGIVIKSPNWVINGINFKGACNNHNQCEHALHLIGLASNTTISNNKFYDFNAAIKVNSYNKNNPDNGIISNNIFGSTQPRETHKSVTPINIDHGNHWLVSRNIIHDFIKLHGNKVSYGAFMKGGISNGIFENNLIICNSTSHNYPGNQVGLSMGGGGMNKKWRRNNVDYEASNSAIRNNIIVNCNDVGIYSQNSVDIEINNNLLYGTTGIDNRFPLSSSTIYNNILNGRIKDRDNATSKQKNNLVVHNTRKLDQLYTNPKIGNFAIKSQNALTDYYLNAVPQKKTITDFCNQAVSVQQLYIGPYVNKDFCSKQ